MSDIDADEAAHLMAVAHRMVAGLRGSGLRCEGVNLFLADGEAAMQEVFHVHLHVFPRYVGDGFGLKFSERYHQRPERSALEVDAAMIRAVLEARR
jgi:histidine triad (HIT) family protein